MTRHRPFVAKKPSILFALCVAIWALTFSSCKKEGCRNPEAINYDIDAKKNCDDCCKFETFGRVNIELKHKVGNTVLKLDTMKFVNPFNRKFEVTKLIYYLSNFVFHRADGSSYRTTNVFYIDAADSTTTKLTFGSVPNGQYTSLSFIFGLDEATNVDRGLIDTTPNNDMRWPQQMGGGYHYMKLEGRYISDSSTVEEFNTHTGIAYRVADSTFVQNFIDHNLDLPNIMSVNHNKWSIHLEHDINQWYQTPNNYDFPLYGPTIMTNYNAQMMLNANGADAFTATQTDEQL